MKYFNSNLVSKYIIERTMGDIISKRLFMAKIKKKIALILGITGQDGSYLAEFLLKKNYLVHGIKRRTSTPNTSRIDHIFDPINFNKKNLTCIMEIYLMQALLTE